MLLGRNLSIAPFGKCRSVLQIPKLPKSCRMRNLTTLHLVNLVESHLSHRALASLFRRVGPRRRGSLDSRSASLGPPLNGRAEQYKNTDSSVDPTPECSVATTAINRHFPRPLRVHQEDLEPIHWGYALHCSTEQYGVFFNSATGAGLEYKSFDDATIGFPHYSPRQALTAWMNSGDPVHTCCNVLRAACYLAKRLIVRPSCQLEPGRLSSNDNC